MSKFNFSFRRSERKAFKNIAHGLIPAATIAPKPAVPRTPPPRSPNSSPERPRSALAAAILTSSLTGRTFAIPPPRTRSYSESECSHASSHTGFEPYASTALYTRDRWPDSVAGRPRLPSPRPSDEEEEDDEDDEDGDMAEDAEGMIEADVPREESPVYQSIERQSRAPLPHKKASFHFKLDDDTDNSTFEVVSPLNTEDETEDEGTNIKKPPLALRTKSPSHRSMTSPDVNEELCTQSQFSSPLKRKTSAVSKSPARETEREKIEMNESYQYAAEFQQELLKELRELRERNHTLTAQKDALERTCSEKDQQIQQIQQQQLHSSRERRHSTGESPELLSLRQQAQELVDENDGLKMTVHRLNVELSRYQARFRPLTRDERPRNSGLPGKGPVPPWLLDMKYLSPLLLAYEDQLNERDQLLQSSEEELKTLRMRTEEVIQENEKLHTELSKRSSVGNKEWKQLQDQAKLVLEENQVLIEQLELQHDKTKETNTKHTQEVCRVTKQVMLLEAEKQNLETELDAAHKELRVLNVRLQKASSALENSVSIIEHTTTTDKLKWKLEKEEKIKSTEVEALQDRVATLQAEKKTFVLEKNDLNAHIKHLESELQMARQANRKAQRHIDLLKQQIEDSLEKELVAHRYLTRIVMLAEKTTYERDQLVHMASCLEKDKQGTLTRILEGTVRLGKLQEKVKVFKQQASASVCALGQRLHEQEKDFAGKAASFQREIQHLQAQLRDRQEQLSGALQQKREVENELEVVWEAAARENQHLQDIVMSKGDVLSSPHNSRLSLAWMPQHNFNKACHLSSTTSPKFIMTPKHSSAIVTHDSQQHHNLSSDESERNGLDFYS
ncbi:centrosomal protein of 89 kDa [Clarias gariepinus]|uniref:centrosomal protein of 89 kDa isoform X2 n=1 Tax=Clarias gariepinus TaxID=13013 RepID=UPI00234C420B|nr:centrosomal protein of 89 kDa isoform X2 [Clarias gariepinus]